MHNNIQGYLYQCSKVHKYLDVMIKENIEKGQPMIVEGVHLDTDYMKSMIERYGDQAVAFIAYVEDQEDHIKRFMRHKKVMGKTKTGLKEIVDGFERIAEI